MTTLEKTICVHKVVDEKSQVTYTLVPKSNVLREYLSRTNPIDEALKKLNIKIAYEAPSKRVTDLINFIICNNINLIVGDRNGQHELVFSVDGSDDDDEEYIYRFNEKTIIFKTLEEVLKEVGYFELYNE